MKLKRAPNILIQLLDNLRKMLVLAWETDRQVTFWYYLTAGIGALAPLAISLTLKYLIDSLLNYQDSTISTIPLIVVAILAARYAVVMGENLIQWGLNRTYFDYLFRYKLQNELNYRFYKKLAYLDISYLEDPKEQNLITKTKDTLTWRPPDFLRNFSYLFYSLIRYLSAFIILLSFGWWIPFLITIITLPRLYFRAKYGTIQWSIYGSGAHEVRKLWHFMWLLSTETAIREMRIFQSQKALLSKFKSIQQYIFNLHKKPLDNYLRIITIPPILEALILFMIVYSQLPKVLIGTISIGGLTLLVNMIGSLNGGAASSVINLGEMHEHNLYVNDYFKVLDLPKRVKEVKKPIIFDRIVPPKIEFKNVYFQYPDGPLVLKDVSFVVKPGDSVAMVGPNGAGKSTIIKLICRFYDVTEGEILVNGANIKELKLSNWYKFLGTLFQDFVQYHFTVRENITLGDPSKKDDKLVIDAAKKSGAYEFIQQLPKGLDQILGREFEEGEQLSIGQWQKLAIARAFYEQAPVLMLDEPTSAIDAEAEYEIFNNLQKTYKNKTLILVSHRFSTVRNADKILVVENGQITENGTHTQLLERKGKYARMFQTQAEGYK
jgi:ABC-type multidrug transport system fused ATPase/permease subunit